MAERMVRKLIDDLDGTEIENGSGERVLFAVRGTSYQIDLSSRNVEKLDKALKPFIDGAVKVRRGNGRAGNATQRAEKPTEGSAPKVRRKTVTTSKPAKARRIPKAHHAAAIRQWARKNGYELSDRGRLSSEIVAAFQAAN
jgi:hypothetical protein